MRRAPPLQAIVFRCRRILMSDGTEHTVGFAFDLMILSGRRRRRPDIVLGPIVVRHMHELGQQPLEVSAVAASLFWPEIKQRK